MLIDKLRDYYGIADADAVEYINKYTLGMTEAQQNEVAEKIIQSRQRRFGFPDISILAKFLNEGKAKKTIGFYWAVCDDCKAEYDYQFIKCPVCFKNGKRNSGFKVRTSDQGIPGKVIRWNMTTLDDDGKGTYCVSCAIRDIGYCRNFGDPNYMCNAQDFESCECRKCCVFHKKANERVKK